MSSRVMQTLVTFTPAIEIYSIDEAFLDLDRLAHTDLTIARFQDNALEMTPIENVWGIGRRYARFLTMRGIHTARLASVMETLGQINTRMGSNILKYLSTGIAEKLAGKPHSTIDPRHIPRTGIRS